MQKVKFARNVNNDFFTTLRQRVSSYFEERKISRHADSRMVFKSIFMLALYLVPFVISITMVSNPWIFFALWVIMGIGMSGIGLSIMHDANHGAYSENKNVNLMMGYLLNIIGGCAAYWKIQHNLLHHTYTNIHGLDEDISRTKVLRFSPHSEKLKIHRYQHYYAWFLYSLMTISWAVSKEFKQLFEFRDRGLLKGKGQFNKFLLEVVISRIIYFSYMLVLPIMLVPFSGWWVVLSFIVMHLISGLILSCVFQPAHVITDTEYPLPSEDGSIENCWAIHQLQTTANFSRDSRLFSWFVGGLNYQIEHHLFPHICHVHYRDLSSIVEQTAREFNLPYHTEKTWFAALANHGRMLRKLAIE